MIDTKTGGHRLHRLAFAVQQQPTQIQLALGPLIRPGQPAEHLGREPLEPRPDLVHSSGVTTRTRSHDTPINGSDTPNNVLISGGT